MLTQPFSIVHRNQISEPNEPRRRARKKERKKEDGEGRWAEEQETDFRVENCHRRGARWNAGASARGGGLHQVVQLHLRSHATRVNHNTHTHTPVDVKRSRWTATNAKRKRKRKRFSVAPAISGAPAEETRERDERVYVRDLSPTDLTPLLCSFYGRDYGVRGEHYRRNWLHSGRLVHWNTSRLRAGR